MVNTGLQPHTQNTYYLLLLHGNNGYNGATATHSEYVLIITFTRQQRLRERVPM